ncbi:MAG: NAD-dependent epimerase/dehydratase family protein [Geothrix sp.]|uniref:NAD-dependent epimerase/dehydratase family protein n=1 Tax=Geothrix sp. TaxID=1962974 RepID=UPI00181BEEF6|nr:NAD-dependent epimerase/dehydratase family protein [Geothrix sp.]NWJ41647.1 NAD-dependent epimerase/dehydratase family protein [Geothrix sp.]WIL20370.1 MAG: NAD-dependent epimerase/dehydratase family protein [Geothrix sp.]
MSKPKILITGGLGFIGLRLGRRLLDAGCHVVAIDNLSPQIHGALPVVDLTGLVGRDFQVIRGDAGQPEGFAEALGSADALVHLAAETGTAQSMYELARYNAVNSQGTAALLQWLQDHPHRVRKVVLASSRSVYGEGAYRCGACGPVAPDARTADRLDSHQWDPVCPACGSELELIPTPETSRPRPSSIYAATKLAQEDLVRIACGAFGIPFSILRFQNVYGPGQSLHNPYTGILSIFSTRIRRGLDLPIFEDGKESRDFIHVEDIAEAIRLCLESEATDGQTMNVGTGIPTSVWDMANQLVRAFGGASKTHLTAQYRLGDIRHCFADISLISRLTGFTPRVSLEEGLAGFARWVDSQPLPEDGLDRANRTLLDKGLMK